MKIETNNTNSNNEQKMYTGDTNQWPSGTYVSTDGKCSVIKPMFNEALLINSMGSIFTPDREVRKQYIKVSSSYHIKAYEI